MATGTYANFQIYQPQFKGGMNEVLQQNTDAFNAASRGAIRLLPQRLIGDYEKESFLKSISGIITRRDTSVVTTVTDKAMEQDENVGVKINRRIGPVAQTLDAWKKIGGDAEEFSFKFGQQVANDIMVDYLNAAIRAAAAAIRGVSSLVYDSVTNPGAGTYTMTHRVLNRGLEKFGDRSSRITCWVMHSAVWHDLIDQALVDKITDVANVAVNAGTTATLGRPVIVTDSSALVETSGSSGTTYLTLGLAPDAVTVKESEQQDIISDLITGLENIVMRIQGEFAYNLGVKGFKWDVTNGGQNPTDTAVGTSQNWDRTATDVKDCAGVLIVTE